MSYRHLKVFGCVAYVHVAKDQRGKLDPKTRPCIFLGYGDDEFGYRVWDLVSLLFSTSPFNVFLNSIFFQTFVIVPSTIHILPFYIQCTNAYFCTIFITILDCSLLPRNLVEKNYMDIFILTRHSRQGLF